MKTCKLFYLVLTVVILCVLLLPAPAFAQDEWELLGFAGEGVLSIAYSPNYANDHTIFVGTYDGTDSYLFRSTDRGASWVGVAGWTGSIRGILFSPSYVNDNTLFASAGGTDDGIRRSTDGGVTWAAVGPNNENVWSLAISPDYANDRTLFAGTSIGHVFRSVDGGDNWVDTGLLLPSGYTVRALAISPNYANDRTIFAGMGRDWDWYNGGVYRSTDGGDTWEAISNGLTYQEVWALAISPDYGSDQTLFVAVWAGGIYRSTNGGNSWSEANNGQPNRRPGNGPTLVFSPDYGNDRTVFYGTWGEYSDGGVYRSTDSGASWTVMNTGLDTRWLHCLAIPPNYGSDPILLAGGEITNGGGLWVYDFEDDTTPPAAVTDLTASPGSIAGTVKLSWTTPGDDGSAGGLAGQYDVRYSSMPINKDNWDSAVQVSDEPTPGSPGSAQTMTISSLATGTQWYFAIETADEVPNWSGLSNVPSLRDGGFRPDPDGYSFDNFNYYGADWEQFKAAFPDSDVEFLGFPRPRAWLFFQTFYRGVGRGGNCHGFSSSSLVRFANHPETVEDDLLTPEHNTLPHVHDMPEVVPGDVRPGQSDVKDYIHLYQARLLNRAHFIWKITHLLVDNPLDSYQTIRAALSGFRNAPVMVHLSNVGGRGAHSIVPYSIEETDGTAKIYVYDNNWHDDETRFISMTLTTGAWSYTLWQGETWGDSTGSRGLLAPPMSIAFPSRLPWDILGNLRIAAVGSDGDLLISDSLGRRLGYRNGQMVSEIPDGVFMPVAGFNPDDPDAEPLELYSLPVGDYRIEAQGVASGVYTITAFASDVGLGLAGLTTSVSQTNVISVTSDLADTQFQPAEKVRDYCFTHAAEFIPTQPGRTLELCTTTSARGVASFEVASDSTEFRYHNDGQPTTYTFCVQDMGEGAAVCESGSLGSGETFTWRERNASYLPIILKHQAFGSDLVVDSLVATSDAVTITIKNQGNVTVPDEFWVDVYFNPSVTPSLNQPWDTIASHGVVWGVTTPIAANGGTLTLTTGDAYYVPEYSSTPPLPVGADVYALVDSINYDTTYGVVLESDEDNNLLGPVTSTASVAGEETSVGDQGQPTSVEGLPPRR